MPDQTVPKQSSDQGLHYLYLFHVNIYFLFHLNIHFLFHVNIHLFHVKHSFDQGHSTPEQACILSV